MRHGQQTGFSFVRTEGAILPADLLSRIHEGDETLGGLRPEDYHLLKGERLNEAISRSWNRMLGAWSAFNAAYADLPPGDPAIALTREKLLLPLCDELHYGRLTPAKALEVQGKSYPVSHGWQRVPIHLVGYGIPLDTRTAGVAGAARFSPHGMMQELLNRSDEHIWGFLSNGATLRILRDNASLTRQAFVEFNLESIFEGQVYSDFALLWMLCHQSRVEADRPEDFWLERWSQTARTEGARALDRLRNGVEDALRSLGRGFIAHPANQTLRERLRAGELSKQDYYRQLLRLVYRLIFLFAAEDRDLLLLPDTPREARARFLRFYSTSRLRTLAARRRGTAHSDLYQGLLLIMRKLGSPGGCPEMGLPPLGSFLWSQEATSELEACRIANHDLLAALRDLAFSEESGVRRPIDYKNLGAEELGSVYEALLELEPHVNLEGKTFDLHVVGGSERKTTGSYYTPSGLIQQLLDTTLDPVIDRAVAAEVPQEALLDLRVCDPACGSGHFLVAAAHRIARRLASLRTGDEEPSPDARRHALRDVIRCCIYGVDVNPLAVELCKVNLWLETLDPGKPLSFLDSHIQCGDSLMGVFPGLDITTIPDEAFNPTSAEDKSTCAALRDRNRRERVGQLRLFTGTSSDLREEQISDWLMQHARQIDAMPEDSPVQLETKSDAFSALQSATEFNRKRLECDIWTAAFFWRTTKGDAEALVAPTHQALVDLRLAKGPGQELVSSVSALARQANFFHWELAFPSVFLRDDPGFDCVLGNPPWDTMQLEELQFFYARDPDIAALSGAKRKRRIEALTESDPGLAQAFLKAKHSMDAARRFARFSGRYSLATTGKLNSDTLFAELAYRLMARGGRVGIIVPIGILTDESTKGFFSELIESGSLVASTGFENEEFIFPGVANVVSFCALVLARDAPLSARPTFAFYLRRLEQVREQVRFFRLSPDEIKLLNPNTLTCPVFRTENDARLTLAIYARFPVFHNEAGKSNPWDVRFTQGLFNTTSESHLFATAPGPESLPLYEAKLFWFYDHRFASYDLKGVLKGKGGRGLPEMPLARHQDPRYAVTPRYWVATREVEKRLPPDWSKGWLIAFRGIATAKVERTAVFSVIPRTGAGDTAQLMFPGSFSPFVLACLVANCSSIIFDYTARQKIAGTHMNFFFVKQLPIIPPDKYTADDIAFITPRVLELVYTAYDLTPFAADLQHNHPPFVWDDDRRATIRTELDAYFAHLYGLSREQVRYILDPHEVHGPDFPGETFRVLREKETKLYGEFRTQRQVLQAYDQLQEASRLGAAYKSPLDPPPADPRVAHPPRS